MRMSMVPHEEVRFIADPDHDVETHGWYIVQPGMLSALITYMSILA
jgi:hypothetical protein